MKAGHVQVSHVRDLRGVLDREGGHGCLLTMEEPTKPMRTQAASGGFYESGWGAGEKTTTHPKIQMLTIGQLLAGATLDLPPSRDIRTHRKLPRAKPRNEHDRDKDIRRLGAAYGNDTVPSAF